jgi:hypothetical protein
MQPIVPGKLSGGYSRMFPATDTGRRAEHPAQVTSSVRDLID